MPCCGFTSVNINLLRKGKLFSPLWPQGKCYSAVFVADVFPVPGGAKVNCMTSPVLEGKMQPVPGEQLSAFDYC